MADYSKKGFWLGTVKTYDESSLPKDVRKKVRREYYDYTIFLVLEYNDANQSVYLINIEDKKSWMKFA